MQIHKNTNFAMREIGGNLEQEARRLFKTLVLVEVTPNTSSEGPPPKNKCHLKQFCRKLQRFVLEPPHWHRISRRVLVLDNPQGSSKLKKKRLAGDNNMGEKKNGKLPDETKGRPVRGRGIRQGWQAFPPEAVHRRGPCGPSNRIGHQFKDPRKYWV